MDAYAKRPGDTVKVQFDMRDFVAEVDPAVVTFLLKYEEGLDVEDESTITGLIELSITSGRAGRVYVFGIEAVADGQSRTDMRRMRLVDPSEWPTVPGDGIPVGPGAGQSQYADNYADNYA